MKRVLFHAGGLSLRGASVALFDYACGNEDVLGNRSLVTYYPEAGHDPGMLAKFSERFELVTIAPGECVHDHVRAEQADLFYTIKSGERDDDISRDVPSLVHAVFRTAPADFHGSAMAFVSGWLSHYCSNGCVPAVPHMIRLPDETGDLRGELGIPEDATVFGCHGGPDSFDLAFARRVVAQVAEARPDVWFLFLNISPFATHPRIRFLPGSPDMRYKTAFINTADAMLHARKRGETFGLACGEFSARNRPVLTYGCSGERNHIDVLGDKALCYYGPRTLTRLLQDFDREQARAGDWDCYSRQFAAEPVMRLFEQHLIAPALANGPGDNPAWRLDFADRMACLGNQITRRQHRLSRFWGDWLG